MEWKPALQGTMVKIWMRSDEWLWRYVLLKNLHIMLCHSVTRMWTRMQTTRVTAIALLVLPTGELITALFWAATFFQVFMVYSEWRQSQWISHLEELISLPLSSVMRKPVFGVVWPGKTQFCLLITDIETKVLCYLDSEWQRRWSDCVGMRVDVQAYKTGLVMNAFLTEAYITKIVFCNGT